MVLNIGHRGASSLAPENTIASFRTAIAEGADGFELDVQLTKDGVPVVIHDETLNRTTSGQGFVKDQSFRALRQLDGGRWFSKAFAGEPIPSLEEVLRTFRDQPITINVELKNDIIPYPGLEIAVSELLQFYQCTQQIIVSSSNHESLFRMASHIREVRIGVLYRKGHPGFLEGKLDVDKSMTVFSDHPHYSLLNPPLSRARSTRLIPWTVNTPQLMKRCLKNPDVFGIITDFPQVLSEIKKSRKKWRDL